MSKFKAINQTHNIQITKFEYFHSEKFETLLICEQGPVSRTIFFIIIKSDGNLGLL